jgi:hypothetical protein
MDLVKAMAPKTSRIGGDPVRDQAENPAGKKVGPLGRPNWGAFAVGVFFGSFLRAWKVTFL